MNVLVVNAGSTSLKYKLIEMEKERILIQGKVERIGEDDARIHHSGLSTQFIQSKVDALDHFSATQQVINLMRKNPSGFEDSMDRIDAIGFKAVHAGPLTEPMVIDDSVIAQLKKYSLAAPLHNPIYIQAMNGFDALLPAIPKVAVFETGFHKTIPDYAYIYSVPYFWYEKYGIRRYGFHGASFTYICNRLTQLTGRDLKSIRIIACHLGGSSSVCAIRDGNSIDTSMGFTPQSGVPMSTRIGDIDPFILPYIQEQEHLTIDLLKKQLTVESGLLGISGISGDVRDLEEAAKRGQARAILALEAYSYQVKKYIGAYAAALGGVDILVFSGGIGENSTSIRERVCRNLHFLGIEIDSTLNEEHRDKEGIISAKLSKTPVYVVKTDEEIVVARATAWLLERRKVLD